MEFFENNSEEQLERNRQSLAVLTETVEKMKELVELVQKLEELGYGEDDFEALKQAAGYLAFFIENEHRAPTEEDRDHLRECDHHLRSIARGIVEHEAAV